MDPTCSTVRDSLSARLDGEDAPLSLAAVQAHLDGCGPCTTFAAEVDQVSRRARVVAAEAVPDLTAPILAAVAAAASGDSRRRVTDLRVLIAIAGAAQLLLALPLLLGGDVHVGRDLATFELAFGVGLLAVAADPRRAAGLLPMAAVLVAAVAVGVTADLVSGRTQLLAELPHTAELVGLGALWWLARLTPVRRRSHRPVPA